VFGNADEIYNLSNQIMKDSNIDLDLRYELKLIYNKEYNVENSPLLT